MKFNIVLFLFFSVLNAQRVVGYYPYWVQDTFPPQGLDLETFTHINHSFAWPDEEGGIESPADFFDASIADHIHSNNRKFILALGGWGHTEGFVASTSTYELRSTFISSIIDKIIAYGYDGVDIDWEYPQTTQQKNNLTYFIEELDSVLYDFDPELLITMAVPISNWSGQWLDMSALTPHVDFFNAMTYDIHGSWSSNAGHNSPLYQSPPGDPDGSVETGINYLVNTRGLPENKVNIGIPFWGKKYNASTINGSFSGSAVDMHYSEILPLINNGWTYEWDNVAKCPYLVKEDQSKIITYDDPLSIQYKCEFGQSRNLGGVMVWALGYDDMNSEESLTASINSHWLNAENNIKSTLTSGIELYSYPNPFNPLMKINFYLPKRENVDLKLFDIRGRLIKSIVSGEYGEGSHLLSWSPSSTGLRLSNGIYIVELNTPNQRINIKVLYLK
tara:strand:- start:183 stop:1520 length:1338 start_codon:yes stop_codon:yes gene_type:complete